MSREQAEQIMANYSAAIQSGWTWEQIGEECGEAALETIREAWEMIAGN